MFSSSLKQFVHAAFEARRDPQRLDELQDVRERGWDRCPRCGMRLGLEGYRRTETRFMSEEVIHCYRCGAKHLISSHVIH